jgi:hypothetical protein
MATTCPYCNVEVRESEIEAEDGCCPECGASIGAVSSFLDDPDEMDEFADDYEADIGEDVFSELDDDDNDFARADLDEDDIFLDDDLDSEFADEEFDIDTGFSDSDEELENAFLDDLEEDEDKDR